MGWCCTFVTPGVKVGIEWTHTICFSISFYNVNPLPMSPITNLHCETAMSACSSG